MRLEMLRLMLWWRWLLGLRALLGKLSALDNILDHFLLLSPLLSIAPPHRTLIIASQAQVSACFTSRLTFFALLSSKSACKTT